MNTKMIATPIVGLWIAGLIGSCQPTADPVPVSVDDPARTEPEGPGQSTAVYQVGSLDDDTIKRLNQALAGKDCVLATKPDIEQGRFAVTYLADRCCPNSIMTLLAEVRPAVELQGAGAAAPTDQVDEQGSCGGCPYRNSCGKQGE